MPVIGSPRTFHSKFKFVVDIDNIASAGFQNCSELSAEIAKIEYYEGGSLIANKSPGRVSFSDITLERGATNDRDLYDWFKEVVDVAAGNDLTGQGLGSAEPDFRRSVSIVQMARDGTRVRRWDVTNAWPTKFVAGEWDNNSDENNIESVTLTYDTFDLVQIA